MSTYPKPPASPDLSLPSIGYTAEPKMSPAIVDPSAFSDVPQKALGDQISDNERQARMLARLTEIKERFKWDTSRAWTYLRDVVKDPLFQIEIEQSPEPVGASLAQQKEIVRHHVTAQLAELDAELRREYPGLSPENRMALSQQRDPELHRYARAIESGEAWRQPAKPAPIYRYTPSAEKLLAKYLPKKVEARKPAPEIDKRDCVLVYASSGELVDIELR